MSPTKNEIKNFPIFFQLKVFPQFGGFNSFLSQCAWKLWPNMLAPFCVKILAPTGFQGFNHKWFDGSKTSSWQEEMHLEINICDECKNVPQMIKFQHNMSPMPFATSFIWQLRIIFTLFKN